MTNAEYAKQLLELFGENGEHWCKGKYALDKDRAAVHPIWDNACSWCILGAMEKIIKDDNECYYFSIAVQNKIKTKSIAGWNDCPLTTWEDVKMVLTEIAGEK